MRYVSIDIETTGLDPEKHQVIEIGAVIDELFVDDPLPVDELPSFQTLIHHDPIVGEVHAIGMHRDIWLEMRKGRARIGSAAMLAFMKWLEDNGFETGNQRFEFTAAGKNFGSFDWQFLKRLPHANRLNPRHRVLDPTILYLEPGDTRLPDMKTCLWRMNYKESAVKHRALDDAKAVVRLLRHKLNGERS